MYEIVNKGLNNLNGVYSGVARHNTVLCPKKINVAETVTHSEQTYSR
jgi:hypothetical protein